MQTAIRNMHQALADATSGTGANAEALRQLGLDITTLRNMKPEDAFWAITGAIAEQEDATAKVDLATQLFGSRVGTDLIPMMSDGKDAIASMKQEAHDLNLVFTDEQAKAADAVDDNMNKAKKAFEGLRNSLGEVIAPALAEFATNAVTAIQPLIDFVKEHPAIVKAFMAFGTSGAIYLALLPFFRLLVAMNILQGPTGWAAAIAASAIVAIPAIVDMVNSARRGGGAEEYAEGKIRYNDEWLTPEEYAAKKGGSYAQGGIVPGPIGQPRLVMAHGGEEFAGVGRGFGPTINIYPQGSVITERDLLQFIREGLFRNKSQNYTSGL
jgi:hypothetical protein